MIDYMYKMMNRDGLRVQKVPYMKFSVIIKWGQVWRVPAGQKGSLPTLVTYPNKTEELILDDRLYIYIYLNYSIVKDSNADLTVGNWESKIDP